MKGKKRRKREKKEKQTNKALCHLGKYDEMKHGKERSIRLSEKQKGLKFPHLQLVDVFLAVFLAGRHRQSEGGRQAGGGR